MNSKNFGDQLQWMPWTMRKLTNIWKNKVCSAFIELVTINFENFDDSKFVHRHSFDARSWSEEAADTEAQENAK